MLDCSFPDNQLGSFPDGAWPSLKHLLLFKNQLSRLPDSLVESPAIEELTVFNNKLIRLPAPLSNGITLVDLNVAAHKLKTIQKTDKWVSLMPLGISWNNIVSAPTRRRLWIA